MSNTLLTPTMVTKESLRILENLLTFSKGVNREYDDRFAVAGAKIGATLTIRKPNRFTVSSGAALSIQDITDPSVVLTIDTQNHVDTNLTSEELTLDIDMFADRILKPKMAALANQIDYAGCSQYVNIWSAAGTAGTDPNSVAAVLGAQTRLLNQACPFDGQVSFVINPAANGALVGGLSGLFQSASKIADQYEEGNMGRALGFKFSMDQNVARHSNGPQAAAGGGTVTVLGASQTGTSLITQSWSNGTTISAGTIFTIANVMAVNPQNRQSTGQLQQFVVTTAATAPAAGTVTFSIQPPIYSDGAFQTVNGTAANGAVLTLIGSASTQFAQNLAFHRDAFTLATVDLEDVSKYGAWGARMQHKGISLRVARQYRVGTDDVPCRMDVLYGWKTIYPELACRVYGA